MTEPIAEPDDEMPSYLRDEPPVEDPEPAAPATVAEVVQLPGTKRRTGAAKNQPGRKPPLDLARLQLEYESGNWTTRELGARCGRSASRVVQYAKLNGWVQDTRERARAQSAIIVNDPALLAQIQQASAHQVSDVAALMALVRSSHRGLILEQREVLSGLLAEIRAAAKGEDFKAMLDRIERESNPDKKVEFARAAINRVLALPSRIYGIKKLSDAAKNIIALERQAFDLDAAEVAAPAPPKDTSVTNAEVFAWLSQVKEAAR